MLTTWALPRVLRQLPEPHGGGGPPQEERGWPLPHTREPSPCLCLQDSTLSPEGERRGGAYCTPGPRSPHSLNLHRRSQEPFPHLADEETEAVRPRRLQLATASNPAAFWCLQPRGRGASQEGFVVGNGAQTDGC